MDTRPDPARSLTLVDPAPDPVPDPTRPVTTSDLAAELGTSNPALRKWARRRGLLPEPAAPGAPVVFSTAEAEALRAAWSARYAEPGPARPPLGTGQPVEREAARPDPTRHPERVDPGDGWREALAEARATAARLESELRQARQGEQLAREAADHAERRAAAAETHLAALRVVVWRWYAEASRVGWWQRLRGRLPAPPAELMADKLLAAPKG